MKTIGQEKIRESELDVRIQSDGLEAENVELSSQRIQFETKAPLEIDVVFKFEDNSKTQTGRLASVKKSPNGNYIYNFEYINGLKN